MKRFLYIIRHAKAEDSSSFFGDFDRELTSSGTIDAARMGKLLADKGVKPDLLISSSAARAFQTARIISEQLHYEYEAIKTTRDLYDNGPKAYLAAVTAAPDKCHHLMVFGHNPDISYFAKYLTNHDIGSMSKGSVVIIEFDNLDWNEVSSRTGTFISYNTPKEFRR